MKASVIKPMSKNWNQHSKHYTWPAVELDENVLARKDQSIIAMIASWKQGGGRYWLTFQPHRTETIYVDTDWRSSLTGQKQSLLILTGVPASQDRNNLCWYWLTFQPHRTEIILVDTDWRFSLTGQKQSLLILTGVPASQDRNNLCWYWLTFQPHRTEIILVDTDCRSSLTGQKQSLLILTGVPASQDRNSLC